MSITPSVIELRTYFVTARNLWVAARILLERPEYSTTANLLQPTHTLLGFSIENYLKSFLIKAYIPAKTLEAGKMRHDLAALCLQAKSRGLEIPGTGFEGLVQLIGAHHGEFGSRYLSDGDATRVPPRSTVVVMNEVDRIIGDSLRADLAPLGVLGRLRL